MKKLIALFLISFLILAFKPITINGLNNLVGHTWQVDYKQVNGDPDVSKIKEFSQGVKENIINFKVKQLNHKTNKYEYYSEGIIVYNSHSNQINFSETHYSGDVYMGEVKTFENGDFIFIYKTSSFADSNFNTYYEEYTLKDESNYMVNGYMINFEEKTTLNQGTSKRLK